MVVKSTTAESSLNVPAASSSRTPLRIEDITAAMTKIETATKPNYLQFRYISALTKTPHDLTLSVPMMDGPPATADHFALLRALIEQKGKDGIWIVDAGMPWLISRPVQS